MRATEENRRGRTARREKPSALPVPKAPAPAPRSVGPSPRPAASMAHPYPKDGPVLDVANPCSELQTSLLLNSRGAPCFLRVRQFRVPS